MTRAPAKKPAAKKPAAKKPAAKKPLPEALVKVGKAARAQRVARLAQRGRDALARVRERQTNIAANMVDIGLALVELKADGVAEALGRRGFTDLVAQDLAMSLTTANALIALATRVPREVTQRIGHGRAALLLELADATPEDDAPQDLLDAKIELPSGKVLDVPNATDRELREGAKELRAARAAPKSRRGFTTTREEKAAYARFAEALRGHAGELLAQTKLVATRDGKGPKLRVELRFAELRGVLAALRKAMGP